MSSSNQTPLIQAIEEYQAKNRQRQHMPGHKGQKQALGLFRNWGNLAGWDLTEADGLDDLHSPAGALKQAQEMLAAVVGAKQAHFLVNGATVGILAAILAATAEHPGCSVLLPRNAHRAAWNALALADCQPVWLPVQYLPHGLPLGITPQQLQTACQNSPGCQAAFFVYPSYYGVCVDLAQMLAVCRENQLISIVDEAHGAHLPFIAPDMAATRLGANLVIDSWHKSMGSLGQTAVLLQNDRPDQPGLRPERWLTMLQTSSPSYPLLASLDAARAEWSEQAAARGLALQQEREAIAEALQQTKLLRLYNAADLPSHFSYDQSKALLYSAAAHSGWQLAEALRQSGLEPEFADWQWVLLLLSYADMLPDNGLPQLLRALRRADYILQQTPPRPINEKYLCQPPSPQKVLNPAEAMRKPIRKVQLKSAAGLLAAGLLTPYPPGIPWLGPGELIEPEHIAAAESLLQAGGRLQGVENGMISVLDFA